MGEFSEVDEFIDKDDSRIALLFEQIIPLERYPEYYSLCCRNQNIYFTELYSRFYLLNVLPHKSSDHVNNMGKNRYADICTSDRFRVYLWENDSQKLQIEEREKCSEENTEEDVNTEIYILDNMEDQSDVNSKTSSFLRKNQKNMSSVGTFLTEVKSYGSCSHKTQSLNILASMDEKPSGTSLPSGLNLPNSEEHFCSESSQDARLASFHGYINATFIGGAFDKREYIATQGPLDNTVDDFYIMVWQQQCKSIIMLCCVVEAMREKCADYLPTFRKSVKCNYNGMKIELLKSRPVTECLTVSILKMRCNTEVRFVTHYHYSGWPDRGVPIGGDPFNSVILLQQLLMWTQDDDYSKPMIVHCSAGVGRTGTFIAFDMNVKKLLDGDKNVSICPLICRMRKARPCMVQTEDQFIFIHSLLTRHVQTTYLELNYCKFYTELRLALSENKGKIISAYWEPFKLLDQLKSDQLDSQIPIEVDLLAYLKKLYFNERKSEFIEIPSFIEENSFMTSYNPEEERAQSFITDIIKNMIKVVVYIGEDGECFNYYQDVVIGKYHIKNEDYKVSKVAIYRQLKITYEDKEYNLLHCQFNFFNQLADPGIDFENIELELSSFILNAYKMWVDQSDKLGTSFLIHSDDPERKSCTVLLCLLLMQNIELTNGTVDIPKSFNILRLYLPRCFPKVEDLLIALKCLSVILNPT